MMLTRVLPVAAVAGILTGCVFAPVVPPRGILYTDQTSPLSTTGRAGEKRGESSAYNILFLVGWGDAGIEAAMVDGGITQVRSSDYRIQNYLLFFQKYTTVVKGE